MCNRQSFVIKRSLVHVTSREIKSKECLVKRRVLGDKLNMCHQSELSDAVLTAGVRSVPWCLNSLIASRFHQRKALAASRFFMFLR